MNSLTIKKVDSKPQQQQQQQEIENEIEKDNNNDETTFESKTITNYLSSKLTSVDNDDNHNTDDSSIKEQNDDTKVQLENCNKEESSTNDSNKQQQTDSEKVETLIDIVTTPEITSQTEIEQENKIKNESIKEEDEHLLIETSTPVETLIDIEEEPSTTNQINPQDLIEIIPNDILVSNESEEQLVETIPAPIIEVIDFKYEWSQLSDNERTLGLITPIWMPDLETDNCLRCSTKFTFSKRRHHCRACGLIFCSKCSNKRLNLPLVSLGNKRRSSSLNTSNNNTELDDNVESLSTESNNELCRVCDNCFDTITKGITNLSKFFSNSKLKQILNKKK
jgi:hypothetical protein